MEQLSEDKKRILVLYFSFSSQTKNILLSLIKGLKTNGVDVTFERLVPVESIRFPIGTIYETVKMMLLTFFRLRMPIKPVSEKCFDRFDLILLAGPTWSYNPSGPILSLFDRDGKKLFSDKLVVPLISCRGYWRLHWFGLKLLLSQCGAVIPNLIVFSHPSSEPWRTMGVFLKLAGRNPEKKSWFKKYYTKYGHTRNQLKEAYRFGVMLGEALCKGQEVQSLDFKSDTSLP